MSLSYASLEFKEKVKLKVKRNSSEDELIIHLNKIYRKSISKMKVKLKSIEGEVIIHRIYKKRATRVV